MEIKSLLLGIASSSLLIIHFVFHFLGFRILYLQLSLGNEFIFWVPIFLSCAPLNEILMMSYSLLAVSLSLSSSSSTSCLSYISISYYGSTNHLFVSPMDLPTCLLLVFQFHFYIFFGQHLYFSFQSIPFPI